MRSWKSILAAAAVTLLVAACGGDKAPAGGNDGASPEASDSASDSADPSAEADVPLPADNLVGQPAPSVSADDAHPPAQWKSQMFASSGG